MSERVKRVLDVHRLIIRTRGRVRAAIGMDGSDVGLAIANARQSSTVNVVVTAEGASRISVSRDGRVGALVGVLPDGTPTMSCHDPQNRARITLSVINESAFLFLWDASQRRRATVGHGNNGTADLVLTDENETRRVVVGVPEEGVPLMALYDDQGLPRVFVGLDAEGNAEVNLHGPNLSLLFSKP